MSLPLTFTLRILTPQEFIGAGNSVQILVHSFGLNGLSSSIRFTASYNEKDALWGVFNSNDTGAENQPTLLRAESPLAALSLLMGPTPHVKLPNEPVPRSHLLESMMARTLNELMASGTSVGTVHPSELHSHIDNKVFVLELRPFEGSQGEDLKLSPLNITPKQLFEQLATNIPLFKKVPAYFLQPFSEGETGAMDLVDVLTSH